jgi:DNA polymerase-1
VAAGRDQHDIVLSTNDKDLFQLVSDKVRVYSTNKADLKHPKDSHALLGVEEVTERWGVPPAGIGEVLALTGDSVDNIPGVDGIGLKTASALIRQFGTVQNLLDNLKDVPSEKVRKRLGEARAQILQNREMVKLDLDHRSDFDLGDSLLATNDNERRRTTANDNKRPSSNRCSSGCLYAYSEPRRCDPGQLVFRPS